MYKRTIITILVLIGFLAIPAALLADFAITATTDTTETARCAVWNESRQEYFAVYRQVAAPIGIAFYEGVRLDRWGNAIAPPVVLPLGFQHGDPSIVHNPTQDEYLLVAVNGGAIGTQGIDAVLIDADGGWLNTISAIAGEPYDRGNGPGGPVVEYNSIADEYLVMAAMDTGSSSGLRDIYAQRVSSAGFGIGSTINVTNGPFTQLSRPGLAYAPVSSVETPTGRYLFAFDLGGSGWAIMLGSDANPIATLWNCGVGVPFEATVPVDWGTQSGSVYRPDVSYGESGSDETFLVVWEDHNNTDPQNSGTSWTGIWGCPVDANELMYCSGLTGAFPVSRICKHWSFPITDPWLPRLDFDERNDSWFVVWRETGSVDPCNLGGDGYYHIRGNYVDYNYQYPPYPNSILSQTTGIAPGNEDPLHPVIACGSNGSALVAWDDNRNSGAGNWRDIYGTIFAPQSLLADVSTPEIKGFDVSHGVAWGDIDGDGDHDLYLSNWAGPNKLFRNDNGILSDITGPPTDDFGFGFGVTLGDVDGDSDLDLYLVNDGPNVYFDNSGTGAFTNATSGALGDAGVGLSGSWADYDRDGDLDLYIAVTGGANRLLQNNSGTFVDIATGALADGGDTYAAVWGDYDNDRNPDLYLANSGTANRLLRNMGNGTFADVTPGVLADAGQARGASWADYDGDGDLDLYLANNAGNNALFENTGGGTFSNSTPAPLLDGLDSHTPAWADHDNDGDLDLYLSNFNGPNRLFRNDGSSFVDVAQWPYDDPGATGGAAWADVDDDGDLDLFTVNSFWQPNRLYRNELGGGNHWLQIDLQGTTSNSFGVGARIRVIENGVARIREVTSGSGFCSMNSLTAEFGFGALFELPSVLIDTIEVLWPSGIVQRLLGTAPNQRITLVEPSATDVAGGSAVPGVVRSLPNAPNPFNPSTVIRYELSDAMPVKLMIYNVNGRLVRRLIDNESRAPGFHSILWDGQDDRGTPVGSGIYLYRFDAGNYRNVHRMTLVR